MTQPKSKSDREAGNPSQTTISYLREIYREQKYGRRNEFESKYTEKGKVQEENAITLFCKINRLFYKKNTERLNNEFITGEPDIHNGETIRTCTHGVDIKCSWSLFTFPYPEDKLCDAYEWQNQSYMFLTGAEMWTTAYCLMNAPGNLITNEKKSIWYKMDMPDEGEAEYVEKCIEVEKNMIFDMTEFRKENPGFDLHCTDWHYDIPLNDRLVRYESTRNEDCIERIKKEVTEARKCLNQMNY